MKALQVSVCTCSNKNEEDCKEDLDESEPSLLFRKAHKRQRRTEILKYLFF